jgi:predicted GNAT family acetyltransferase
VSAATPDVTVTDQAEHTRYEIRVGEELAGFSEYRRRPGLIAFTHTLIDPRFEGRGLGGRLVAAALEDAAANGLAVLPFCPFVRGYIAAHGDRFLELVPPAHREPFDLPEHA